MPSKGLFTKIQWNHQNFIYCLVGNKLFRILSSCSDSIKILDTSPEDNYFSTNKNWYQDFVACFESNSNINKIYYLLKLIYTL